MEFGFARGVGRAPVATPGARHDSSDGTVESRTPKKPGALTAPVVLLCRPTRGHFRVGIPATSMRSLRSVSTAIENRVNLRVPCTGDGNADGMDSSGGTSARYNSVDRERSGSPCAQTLRGYVQGRSTGPDSDLLIELRRPSSPGAAPSFWHFFRKFALGRCG